MHPEIKKFWYDDGYESVIEETGGTIIGYMRLSDYCCRMDTLGFGDRCRYKGKWYSEEQMLRIIRLKAFL
jgi:hypothetical protein